MSVAAPHITSRQRPAHKRQSLVQEGGDTVPPSRQQGDAAPAAGPAFMPAENICSGTDWLTEGRQAAAAGGDGLYE